VLERTVSRGLNNGIHSEIASRGGIYIEREREKERNSGGGGGGVLHTFMLGQSHSPSKQTQHSRGRHSENYCEHTRRTRTMGKKVMRSGAAQQN
jgi:hypothetical protein